jgi:SAM (Sterile alpha motif) domain-containing protein
MWTAASMLGVALWNLATWLRDLGLERYEATFRENEIDVDALQADTRNPLGRSGCCARPPSGHATAAPPINAITSRLSTAAPRPALPRPLKAAVKRRAPPRRRSEDFRARPAQTNATTFRFALSLARWM